MGAFSFLISLNFTGTVCIDSYHFQYKILDHITVYCVSRTSIINKLWFFPLVICIFKPQILIHCLAPITNHNPLLNWWSILRIRTCKNFKDIVRIYRMSKLTFIIHPIPIICAIPISNFLFMYFVFVCELPLQSINYFFLNFHRY